MTTIGFVFPGQGSQKVGMGRDWAEASEAARAVFEEADDMLGFSLSRLCWQGPEEDLQLTANTQPAILTCSVAIHRAIARHDLKPVATTCNQANFDTKLAVYDSTNCADQPESVIGCNDDGPGCANFTSELTVPVTAGQGARGDSSGSVSGTNRTARQVRLGDGSAQCFPSAGPRPTRTGDAVARSRTTHATGGAVTDGVATRGWQPPSRPWMHCALQNGID